MCADRPRPTALPRVPAAWVALAFGVLCIAIEAVLEAADARLIGSAHWRPWAYQNGAFWAGLLGNWRPNYAVQPVTMFFSYAFLHGGFWHLAGNIAALWSLLRAIGPRLGAGRFVVLWLITSAGGGAAFAWLASGPAPMVGASGALFGLAGAWMTWEAMRRRRAGQSLWPLVRTLAILVALHPLLWLAQAGMLAWQTHLGGFLAGAATAWAMGPPGRVFRTRNRL